jgi:hypothetical protein
MMRLNAMAPPWLAPKFEEVELELLADKRLTLASYDAGPEYVAYVEFVGVGDELPDMPLFLKPEVYGLLEC